jgi:hypothetical protein
MRALRYELLNYDYKPLAGIFRGTIVRVLPVSQSARTACVNAAGYDLKHRAHIKIAYPVQ